MMTIYVTFVWNTCKKKLVFANGQIKQTYQRKENNKTYRRLNLYYSYLRVQVQWQQ